MEVKKSERISTLIMVCLNIVWIACGIFVALFFGRKDMKEEDIQNNIVQNIAMLDINDISEILISSYEVREVARSAFWDVGWILFVMGALNAVYFWMLYRKMNARAKQ